MTVALVIPKGYQPDQYVGWASQIAASRGQPLLVIDAQTSSQEKIEQVPWGQLNQEEAENPSALTKTATENDDISWPDGTISTDLPETATDDNRLLKIRHTNPVEPVLEELDSSSAQLLILPRHRDLKTSAADFALQRELFYKASCTTLQLCVGNRDPESCRRILVPTRGSRNTAAALRLATDLAESTGGHVDAVYFQQEIDEAAAEAGERIIGRLIDKYADDDGRRVITRSVVCDDIAKGIQDQANSTADLLILGASYHSVLHRLFFSSIREQIIAAPLQPTVVVVRPAAPWSSRLLEACQQSIREVIPQLDRQRRVNLVERIHGSSRWDIDFVALICLSTLIAGLGLVQNSTAVVIGAMLVAPLMTPLLGAGLALVQGNKLLASCTAGTVVRGFLVALVIGWLLGIINPLETATSEMLARCSPGVSDLLIAYASGLAAAYANGRPHLVSALPGVAIAAALVPPIATTGLAISMARWELAFGAGLLFLTNIVAIILGAACSLWAVGIRSTHAHSFTSSWGTRAMVALAIIAIGLGIYESTSPVVVPDTLRQEITSLLVGQRDSNLVDIRLVRFSESQEIQIVVASPNPADRDLLDQLSELAANHFERPTKVRLETRLVQMVH